MHLLLNSQNLNGASMQRLYLSRQVYLGSGLESCSMPTAIASYSTMSGFVVVADGNATSQDRQILSRTAQKIYPIPGHAIAYALYGYVVLGNDEQKDDEPPIVDLSNTINDAVLSLTAASSPDPLAMGAQLAEPVHAMLVQAKTKGLKSYPGFVESLGYSTILHILLWGYWGGHPTEVDILFWHRGEKVGKPSVSFMRNNNSKARIWGSSEVWNRLVDVEDSRFRRFRLPSIVTPVELLSLHDAAKLGESYILACNSEEGRSVDPYMCPLIGGHIHVAAVTPSEFRWMVPPRHRDVSL
jgi:hypothetical protein